MNDFKKKIPLLRHLFQKKNLNYIIQIIPVSQMHTHTRAYIWFYIQTASMIT